MHLLKHCIFLRTQIREKKLPFSSPSTAGDLGVEASGKKWREWALDLRVCGIHTAVGFTLFDHKVNPKFLIKMNRSYQNLLLSVLAF